MIRRRTFLQSLPALAAMPASFPASVLAQAYPSHPVRIIVPVSPGSGSDVVARYMSAELTKALGSAFVVENRLGASGMIGTDFVAKAAPDGYTLLCTYAAHYSNQWVEKTPYDAVRDFEPVARLGMSALLLTTAANSRFRTVQEVIAAAKRKPGGVSFGSSGNGTTSHMAAALMSSMAGIEMTHVPYKGPAQVAVDTASGQVDVGFGGVASSLALVKGGRLRVLAVTSLQRSSQLPDVVTMDEAGLKGYELVSPIWVMAPRGTPPAIVTQLSRAMTAAAATPAFKSYCIGQGLEVDIADAAAVRASAPAELERWKKLVALTQAKAKAG
ncbi:Bug family tripartite tricarboxylate transporter substrate binding protein [Cupriavidus oxalaticus]|uniref:Tripartite tricarboxylate transporter substrate binding protein n=1 Tax=Cupriavidus oxalaticus TaxID=96344 RepID=A0A5P3VCV1_9BURK|nr:tripartite tricarboxylate transporter substrate-binding protein [Cupriavidus oxalaticus]QEZ43665.1 tripartite tricarboxylate transporter substrate binding protein [Cupriavidus oxalaticus]